MKRSRLILLFFINFLLDYALLSRYQILGVVPSISIPLIIILAMYADNENIVYYAIFQGFLHDIAFADILGVNALLFYLIAYYIYNLNKNNVNKLFYGFLAIFISLIFSKIYTLILDYIYTRKLDIDIANFVKLFIIEFLLMSIIFTVFYIIANKVYKNRIKNLL